MPTNVSWLLLHIPKGATILRVYLILFLDTTFLQMLQSTTMKCCKAVFASYKDSAYLCEQMLSRTSTPIVTSNGQ